MELAVIVLLVVIVGMLAVVLLSLRNQRPTVNEGSGLPGLPARGLKRAKAAATDEPLVDVVRLPDGGFQVRDRISGETMLDVHPGKNQVDAEINPLHRTCSTLRKSSEVCPSG